MLFSEKTNHLGLLPGVASVVSWSCLHTLPRSASKSGPLLRHCYVYSCLAGKLLAGCLIPCYCRFGILILCEHDMFWWAVTAMLTFCPPLWNYSFVPAWRDECPFVDLVKSESFCNNMTKCRETAVEQNQTEFFDCIDWEKNTCLLWIRSTKTAVLIGLCRSRNQMRKWYIYIFFSN